LQKRHPPLHARKQAKWRKEGERRKTYGTREGEDDNVWSKKK
jgi:hypothetical protein